MATDNVVRVLFEAVTDKFKAQVYEITGSVTGLGEEGRKVEKELGFKDSKKGVDSFSGGVKNAGANTKELGEEGQKTGDKLSNGFKEAKTGAEKLNNTLNNMMKMLVAGFVANQIKKFFGTAITEIGKTQTALGALKSLGVEDLEAVRQAAVDFSNTWSGTTREDFISASYAIKSGIASLTDEGVAKFTEMAALTAKATKATANEMTNLYAQGYGIYRNQFGSDNEFAEKFSSGISKTIQLYRTSGTEMSSFISSLGASAEKAGRPLSEILAIGGELQNTMSGSEAATKYQAFIKGVTKAGQDLKLSFLDSNNRLKSTADILDVIRKKYGNTLDALEVQELTEAFGRKEAVDFIQQLYDKTGDVVRKTSELNQIMSRGVEYTKEMAEAMNEGVAEKTERLKQRIANIFDKIGSAIEPHFSSVFDGLFDSLDEADASGVIENIAQSIGQTSGVLKDFLIQMLQGAPAAFGIITNGIQWLSQNFNTLINIVQVAIGMWLAYKATMAIINIASNPVLYCIGLLIAGLVTLYTKSEKFRYGVTLAFEYVKLGVLILAKIWLNQFQAMGDALVFLIGWIPGLGDAVKSVADKINKLMDGLDNKIIDTANHINDLKKQTKELKEEIQDIETKEFPSFNPENANEEFTYIPEFSEYEPTAASSASKDKRTVFEKALDDLYDKYKTKEDLIDSQISLEDARGNEKTKKSFQQVYINTLKDKLASMFKLDGLTANADDRNILEVAKNKILTEIARLTNDIKGGIDKLIGNFNTPSDFTALSEYAYNTTNNSVLTRVISTPKLNMYLTVKDLGAGSAAEARSKLNTFVDYFMKDNIVFDGMADVVKN